MQLLGTRTRQEDIMDYARIPSETQDINDPSSGVAILLHCSLLPSDPYVQLLIASLSHMKAI